MTGTRLVSWLWIAAIVVLFCAPLFRGLGQTDYDNDESIYSFSVDMMLQHGGWLAPKIIPSETATFLEKPPLKFWIAGLPIHWGLLPSNEFGMRFWDAVMGSLAFLYVFAIGRRLAGPVCGLTAVWLLFTHGPLVLEHGLRTNNMEAAIFLTYAAGMYHWLAWRASGPNDRGHLFAIAGYFVLGFMTKFVAALFLPLVLGLAMLLKSQDRYRLRRQWLAVAAAALAAAALIAPWFVYAYTRVDRHVFDIMFGAHVVKRFTAYLDPAHLRPWHFYLTELRSQLAASSTAWMAAIGGAVVLWRTVRHRWLEGALLTLWFVVPMMAISTGTSKLYHYAYPFLPPVALAAGYWVGAIATWIWRQAERPAHVLAGPLARRLPRALSSSPARSVWLGLGVASLAIGLATIALGRLNLEIAGTLVLRNASVWRPMTAAALFFALGAPAAALRAALPLALWLSVMPWHAYATIQHRITQPNHPLQDLRACLTDAVSRVVATGGQPPGVWVEGVLMSHRYTYYLYGLGPWAQRNIASDGTVAMHLAAPGEYRPVLLSAERFADFVAHLSQDAGTIVEKAAGRAELPVDQFADEFNRADIGFVPLDGAALLLPGPYRGCGPERFLLPPVR